MLIRKIYILVAIIKFWYRFLMFQHLIRAGLHQTHRAFRSECSALNIPIQSVSPPDEINITDDKNSPSFNLYTDKYSYTLSCRLK